MYYKEAKVEPPRKRNIVWKNFDHEVATPKDVGFWWVDSTWFRIKRVHLQFQALSVGSLGDNT
eukprot:12889812-Prorocentrum_lima.AAC.1